MVGERDDIEIDGFYWDYGLGGNVEHLHDGVTPEDVDAVLAWGPIIHRNLPDRKATHAMVGKDGHGRSLIIYIRETSIKGIWEPVTGWRSWLAHELIENEGRS